MEITVLGSGTSQGVPVIGCSCPVCTSADSRDRRMRSSLYIKGAAGERAVIDTGPEFRLQALGAGLGGLDAVFLTHAHADHVHGLDDIRPLSREKPIPVYGNRQTITEFRERFAYIFKTTQQGGGKPQIDAIPVNGPVRLGNLVFTPIPVKHGNLDILGWKLEEAPGTQRAPATGPQTPAAPGGQAALYVTDCTGIPQSSYDLIADRRPPETAIIGGLRVRPHETHFSFEQALRAGLRTGARRVYITHICHDHTHRQIEEYCREFTRKNGPAGITMGPAWDGLKVSV
ncbi:MAG: MBL fold metallo-hydrolase [Treponema sp.]|jgi:phosphoribosyl 1,2-cyclic phosphate phosphodiesterase|nr:MBL fold metallo-hydrolase [Treponema sp.]